jgi:hypothetical protein
MGYGPRRRAEVAQGQSSAQTIPGTVHRGPGAKLAIGTRTIAKYVP